MKRPNFRFNPSRFATPTPFPIKSNLNQRVATILFRAEISFLVTSAVFIGIHVAKFYMFRREVPTSVDFRVVEFTNRPQGCSSSPPLRADHLTPVISRLSLTALDWPSTVSSPSPSPPSQEIAYLGPGALLDDDSAASCFAFSGSSGGAVLVSTSGRYAITRFTLDNTVVDTVVESIYYPKEGTLWGLFEGPLPEGLKNTTTSFVAEHAVYIIIGDFCFSLERGLVQTFTTDDRITSFPTAKFSVFYLEVSSNWGGSHTCLGRVRLHGNP